MKPFSSQVWVGVQNHAFETRVEGIVRPYGSITHLQDWVFGAYRMMNRL